MAKVTLDLSSAIDEAKEEFAPTKVQEVGEGLLNPYEAEWRKKLKKRKQYTIGSIPTAIIEDIEKEYKRLKMTKIEYFYHILRNAGHDIPSYDKMDRRVL